MWHKTLITHVLGNEWIRKRYDTLWNEEGDTWKCNVRSYHQFDWAFALNFVGVFLMWNIYFKFRLLLSLCFGVGGHKSHKPKHVTCVLPDMLTWLCIILRFSDSLLLLCSQRNRNYASGNIFTFSVSQKFSQLFIDINLGDKYQSFLFVSHTIVSERLEITRVVKWFSKLLKCA